MTHVPYKGAAPAMAAVQSGEVNMMFGPTTQEAPHVRSGRVKALGVAGSKPSPLLAGVKPLAEQGFQGLVFENWFGVFAPTRKPDTVAEAIAAGWKQVMGDADVRAKLSGMDPERVRQAISSDLQRWRELARRAGIKLPN